MSEAVRKTALGGYRAVSGDQDSECTHVILTIEEYNALHRKIRELNDAVYRAEINAEVAIENEKRQADIRISESQKKVEEIQMKLVEVSAELQYQTNLNKNLLRISRERANADRNLRPKKEHTGFAVVSSREKDIRYKDIKNPKKYLMVTLWESIIQSPYAIDFTEDQVRREVSSQLLNEKKDADEWMISRIGINGIYNGSYDEMLKEKNSNEWLQANALLNWKLRANYQSSYWEVIILHTKPLGVIPMDMRPAQKIVNEKSAPRNS